MTPWEMVREAAPDLLAACIHAAEALNPDVEENGEPDTDPDIQCALDFLYAAIAKAKGE